MSLLNFNISDENYDKEINFKQRLTDNGLDLVVKNDRDYRYKIEIKDREKLVTSFITPKLTQEVNIMGDVRQHGIAKIDLEYRLDNNVKIPKSVQDELIIALASADNYLSYKRKNMELTEGLLKFGLDEIKESISNSTFESFLKNKAEHSFHYLNGNEMNERYSTDKMNKFKNYAVIAINNHTELLIEDISKYSQNYSAVLTAEFSGARKSVKIPELSQMHQDTLFKVLEPKIQAFTEELEHAEIKNPKQKLSNKTKPS